MWQDPELWLVLISLVVTIGFLGNWILQAGDDWLQAQLDSDFVPGATAMDRLPHAHRSSAA